MKHCLKYLKVFEKTESSFISVIDSSKLDSLEFNEMSFDQKASIASALQYRTEECIISMVHRLKKHYGLSRFCFAGGVALNSVVNGKLLSEKHVDEVFIQPAADDSGLSLGAAYYVNHITYKNEVTEGIKNVFLGSSYADEEIENCLRASGLHYTQMEDRYSQCADLLAKGKIVGWFQGRMEYGPRALGNRSILCSPFGERTKEILNQKVKHREGFRPFAAAVLAEHAIEYFNICDSPYMLLVGKPRRLDMPAITHVDGSTRLQTVTGEDSPELHKLLSVVAEHIGVPILLNTSLNVMGEPIVEHPSQAIRCFKETDLDALCIGRYLLFKE